MPENKDAVLNSHIKGGGLKILKSEMAAFNGGTWNITSDPTAQDTICPTGIIKDHVMMFFLSVSTLLVPIS